MKRLLLIFVLVLSVLPLWAQQKRLLNQNQIAQVGPTIVTYTDTTPADGATYAYWVTAYSCPVPQVCLESIPSNAPTVNIPGTGTHTVTLSWTVSTSMGVTGQNIYRYPAPAPPSGISLVVN